MLFDQNPVSVIIIVVISWLAGAGKVAFGVGAGALLTPVAALVLEPRTAIALMAPMMVLTDIVALRHHWGKWSARHILIVVPTFLAGIVIGTLFLSWAPATWLKRAIGCVGLLFFATQMWRRLRPPAPGAKPMAGWIGSVMGAVGGIASAVAHSGGLPISIYFLGAGLTKQTFVATVVGTLMLTDTAKMISYWQASVLTPSVLLAGLALSPAMLLGGRAGALLSRRLTVEQFTMLVSVLLGCSGLLLLITS